ncbi:MAG: phosphoribosylaminoimidazolesuccinocarboxamide synthase [Tissierellia bacterium]|nr:phosphoribosylaminoimidazolesuccinocarboxamide synthase [Tissierellia bacterium]
MELINKGKTKDVYRLESGHLLLKFKDDVTGKDGVFDPGANQVGLSIEGSGKAGLSLTTYFFELFEKEGIPTHFVASNLEDRAMEVLPAQVFGKGLECICRYKAVGSFFRRYGSQVEEGRDLDGLVEFTIKDDEAGDPLINRDALIMIDILSPEDYDQLHKWTREISDLIKDVLAKKGLDLYDIKLEFGRDQEGKVMLIDEVSGGNMRVYKGDEYINPLDLPGLLLD